MLGEYVAHLYCEGADGVIGGTNNCPTKWGQEYRGANITKVKQYARRDGWKFGRDIHNSETCYCKHCKDKSDVRKKSQ